MQSSALALACKGGSQLVQLASLAPGLSLRVETGISELPGYLVRTQCIIQHLLACRGGSQLVQLASLALGLSLRVETGVSELPG